MPSVSRALLALSLLVLPVLTQHARPMHSEHQDKGQLAETLMQTQRLLRDSTFHSKLWNLDESVVGSGAGYLDDYIDHFSLKDKDASLHFHKTFQQLAYSNSSSLPLSYTVTKAPQFNILAFASSPLNRGIIKIEPLDMSEFLVQEVYVPPMRKRDGSGGVGLELKFAGWRVLWRGVEMNIYEATWLENGWLFISQKHIMITSMPAYLSPAPPASLLEAHLEAHPTNANVDADAVTADPSLLASLFILEVSAFNSDVRDTILVFDQGFWKSDKALWQNVQKASWKDVILDPALKSALIHEYQSFFASEAIYKSLGVPWKRGIIFLGPPGNGKTISLKAIMRDAGVAVLYVKSLHTYAGDEMGIRLIFEKARQEAPCLLVFEDIDSMITDNNRSFFLNEVDGLEDNDGLLMLGTTNHFDKLDPALSNRPSRFDRKYTFPDPITTERFAYAEYWRDKLADNKRISFPSSLSHDIAKATKGFSFAYLKEAFVSTLIILATDESQTLEFPKVLMKQIEALKKELESGKDSVAAPLLVQKKSSGLWGRKSRV